MDRLYFDFETFLFAPGMQVAPIVCMSYAYNNDAPAILHANFDGPKMWKLLWDAFRNPKCELVAYSGASAEVPLILGAKTGWVSVVFNMLRKGRFRDPFLREKLARVAKGDHRTVRGLDATLREHAIPIELNKKCKWRLAYGELWNVPVSDWEPEAVQYSLGDIAVRDLFLSQDRRYRQEWFVDEPARVRTAASLALTSAWGFPVDVNHARVISAKTEQRMEDHKALLLREGLLRVEYQKGVPKFIRNVAVARDICVDVYSKMGLKAPLGDVTPTMLEKAYKAAGVQPPAIDKEEDVTAEMLDEAYAAGVQVEGNVCVDNEVCEESGDARLIAYAEYGQAAMLKAKAKRLVRAGEANKPIQTYYDALKATGRTSSSSGDDPKPGMPYSAYGDQIQNQDRAGEEYIDEHGKKRNHWGKREIYIAPGYSEWLSKYMTPEEQRDALLSKRLPDECLVSVDFDAFEMRTWAQCCKNLLGYSTLMDILNNPDRCPHIEMGAMIEDLLSPGTDWKTKFARAYALKGKARKDLRSLAKGPNFGLPGGMGAERLMAYCRVGYGVELTLEKAKHITQVWRQMYVEAQPYLDYISEHVLKSKKRGAKGSLVQFVSGRHRGRVGFCDGSNGFFQGLAGDAATAAGWALIEEAYESTKSPLYGARPLAFIHDEWIFAIKRDRLHAAAHRMRDVQVAAAQKFCPDVMITASPSACYRWSKVAGDPFYIKDGKLSSLQEGGELFPYEEVQAMGLV